MNSSGDIFIADSGNNRIRRIDAVTSNISTVAGNGTAAYSGDGGPATSASLNDPSGVAVGPSGNLYIADVGNHVIRRVDAMTGTITTVAGASRTAFNGDAIAAISANLEAIGVAVNGSGNLVLADTVNNRVRLVDFSTGLIWTLAGDGVTTGCCGDEDGQQATYGILKTPEGVAVAPSATV